MRKEGRKKYKQVLGTCKKFRILLSLGLIMNKEGVHENKKNKLYKISQMQRTNRSRDER